MSRIFWGLLKGWGPWRTQHFYDKINDNKSLTAFFSWKDRASIMFPNSLWHHSDGTHFKGCFSRSESWRSACCLGIQRYDSKIYYNHKHSEIMRVAMQFKKIVLQRERQTSVTGSYIEENTWTYQRTSASWWLSHDYQLIPKNLWVR